MAMTQSVAQRLGAYFDLEARGTNIRTEVVAGATTFLTMAYIVLVNPSILGQAGMPVAAVAAATCFAAAFASILMGFAANTRSRWRRAWGSTPISRLPSWARCMFPGRSGWAAC
jgi:hypothetical protein